MERVRGRPGNSRSFCLLIVLMLWAATCAAQAPCRAGRLVDVLGTPCMLGKMIFYPFAGVEPPDPSIAFQPDLTHPENPGFIIYRFPDGPMLSVDSTYDPDPYLPHVNTEGVWFQYVAVMPCSGAVCETIFAPDITAVTAAATGYSVDLGGFPADFGFGTSAAVHEAWGNCTPGTETYVTATAGEQLDHERPDIVTWGAANSAAFPCVQHTISGRVGAFVEVQQCQPWTCVNVSSASLGLASFYLYTPTLQEFLNGDTGGGASQPLPKAVSPVVLFSAFSAKLEATRTGFQLASTFALGGTSGGIDPLAEPIALQVGPYTVTLPPHSLQMTRKGYYVYEGTVDGDTLQLQIVPGATGSYTLKAELGAIVPLPLDNPTLVALTIGSDFGTAFTVPGI